MNKVNYLPLIIILTTFSSIGGFLCTFFHGEVQFWEIGIKEIVSLGLFILVLLCASLNKTMYSFLIPFVCVAFPTPVSHFFPGVYEQQGNHGVIYPFVNHVELFFLYLVLIHKGKLNCRLSPIVSFLCIGIIISFIANLITCKNMQDVGILTTGLYTIRTLVLISLVINTIHIDNRVFVKGICFSLFFLLFESYLNSKSANLSILTSGSLGSNTFGNVCGQLTCLLLFISFFCKRMGVSKKIVYPSILIGFIIVIASDTRMALLSLILVFSFVLYPRLTTKNKVLLILSVGCVLFFAWGAIYSAFVNSGKYDFEAMADLARDGTNASWSSSTSSLLTRIQLWTTASNMIRNNLFSGIGFNMFDNLKNDYGFGIDVVIDPHNGYFYLLSSLGLIFGTAFIYFLYIRPWIIFRKSPDLIVRTLCIFSMGISICEFTNAGVFKFQIFSFLVFLALYSHRLYRENIWLSSSKTKKKRISC